MDGAAGRIDDLDMEEEIGHDQVEEIGHDQEDGIRIETRPITNHPPIPQHLQVAVFFNHLKV